METQMNLLSCLNKSSVQILITKRDRLRTPISSGSGYFIVIRNKLIITSVAHVTDVDDSFTLIKTYKEPNDDGEYPLFHIGSMLYALSREESKQAKKINDGLDFSFTEIKDFDIINEVQERSVIFDLNEAGEPDNSLAYCFKGYTRPRFSGNLYLSDAHFEFDMAFLKYVDGYYIFKCLKSISTELDYQGCSGAAVFEETGKLIGSVAEVVPGTKFIKVFPIEKGRHLIHTALNNNLL